MLLIDEYTDHPSAPRDGSYELYAIMGVVYVMFSDGQPRILNTSSVNSVSIISSSVLLSSENIIIASGDINITLPDALQNKGHIYTIKNIGVGVLNILLNISGQSIDGETFFEIRNQYEVLNFVSNGMSYFVI